MEDKKGHLQILDVPAVVAACKEKWYNTTLSHVNDSLIRLGIFEGEFHWHKHDLEDEFFYVISGKLLLDLKDETLELAPMQGYTVSKGITHRTRAEEKTIVLMIEKDTVDPKGD